MKTLNYKTPRKITDKKNESVTSFIMEEFGEEAETLAPTYPVNPTSVTRTSRTKGSRKNDYVRFEE